MTANIQIPDNLMQRLQARAKREGVAPDSVAADILQEALGQGDPDAVPESPDSQEPMSEREKVRAVLRKAGMLSEVSPELRKRYVTTRSAEEREALLKELQEISISPTLSEMIIADRKAQG